VPRHRPPARRQLHLRLRRPLFIFHLEPNELSL
jgi:hypothetical protein